MRSFGEEVRGLRLRHGLSQEDLAERTGIAVRGLRNIEAGRVTAPRPATVRRLADAFGLAGAERDAFVAAALVRDPAPAPAPDGATRPEVPAQLPRDAASFAGRADALARLDDGDPLVVISGAGGVGKTTLAVHWAHRHAGRYPGGQLYVNLNGFGPGEPRDPADVLADFLTALGVDRTAVPAGPASRTAEFRSRVAGRRVLILLDNARDADQVRPLLPGGDAGRVIVTSRHHLTGLIATDGARPVPLGVLDPGEAEDLLARRLGAGRVAAEPAAVARLVERCDRMPLALAVVAARAAVHPEASLARLAEELRDPAAALDALDGGDPVTQVRAVFGWSYRALAPAPRRLFAMLGLHPGPDIEPYAAANLAGLPLAETRQALAGLVALHLVNQRPGGRYGMHDLLRAYAAETAATDLSEPDRRAAVARLLAFYRNTVVRCARLVNPTARMFVEPGEPALARPLTSRQEAALWVRSERANLVTTAERAAGLGDLDYALALNLSLWNHWNDHGYSAECLAVSAAAVAATRHGTDPLALSYALSDLAGAHMAFGRYAETIAHGEEARQLLHDHGDELGERLILGNLQELYIVVGDLPAARRCAQEQLAIVRRLGDRVAEAEAGVQLAALELHLGRTDEALAYARRAVEIFEPTDRIRDRGEALWTLGAVHLRRGETDQARVSLLRAQEVFRSAGMYGNLLARVLTALGRLSRRLGERQAAGRYLSESLEMAREFHGPEQMAEALTELGLLRADQGRGDEALALVREALGRAAGVGARREETRAHHALGVLLAAAGDAEAARRAFTRSLELATASEDPYARELAETGLAGLRTSRDGVA
ncbi:MAG TPA: tetratricopeptide repeat protein [Actinoplanes sp.]|nr:tetratricopeptide repeat protein [Actinoplanes sp.]